jgi:Holliday junction resolvase RusA-like endonuclease
MTSLLCQFVVPGEPHGKGRARATKAGRLYTPGKTVAYESLVALAAQRAMGDHLPTSQPVALTLEAVFSMPHGWSEKKRAAHDNEWCLKKPDIDNIAKAIADAGNGVIWQDDRQIVTLTGTKRWGPAGFVRVAVHLLEPKLK